LTALIDMLQFLPITAIVSSRVFCEHAVKIMQLLILVKIITSSEGLHAMRSV